MKITIKKENNEIYGIVSKTSEKRAHIFGTDEFYAWQDFLKKYPEAKMKVRESKSKKYQPKFKEMRSYFETFENSEELTKEMDLICQRAKVYKSPYNYVLDWFLEKKQELKPEKEEPENSEEKENTVKEN